MQKYAEIWKQKLEQIEANRHFGTDWCKSIDSSWSAVRSDANVDAFFANFTFTNQFSNSKIQFYKCSESQVCIISSLRMETSIWGSKWWHGKSNWMAPTSRDKKQRSSPQKIASVQARNLIYRIAMNILRSPGLATDPPATIVNQLHDYIPQRLCPAAPAGRTARNYFNCWWFSIHRF